MKKKIFALMAAMIVITWISGCKKEKETSQEATTMPAVTESAVETQETMPETTAPTVDVLKDEPPLYEDVSMKPKESAESSNRPAETTPPATETPKPTETTPPTTETPKPTETTPPATNPSSSGTVLPDDEF